MGPAGVTVVIIREDLLARSAASLPVDAELRGPRRERLAVQHAAGVRDLPARAGHAVADRPGRARAPWRPSNERKAGKLYAEIDRTGFYRGTAQKDSRSLMNVTFRLPSEELEKQFVKEAEDGRPRRAERPSLRGRHPRVDLQRVSGRGRRRADVVSCRSSNGATGACGHGCRSVLRAARSGACSHLPSSRRSPSSAPLFFFTAAPRIRRSSCIPRSR